MGVVRGTTAQHAISGKVAVAQFFGVGDACKQQGGTVGVGRQQAFGCIEHGEAARGSFVGTSCCKEAEEEKEGQIKKLLHNSCSKFRRQM
ncbi:hypothetical protein [uncultured Bacteroides sp.]|nr:hypothetical protein [uncultured Bacteroides sp.]